MPLTSVHNSNGSVYDVHAVPASEDPRRPEPARAVVVHWHPLIARAAMTYWYAYFIIRLLHLAVSPVWEPLHWAFLFAEHAIAAPSLTVQRLTLAAGKLAKTRARRPLLRLLGNSNLPNVDILITCCGEDPDVIVNTAKAAASQDYPKDCFRVVVLDDAASDEVREKVKALSALAGNVHYSARTKSSTSFAFSKAGNINHALLELQEVKWPAPEFVAVVDNDFIIDPQFLRSTVPHLLLDPKQAMVSVPIHFYNLPPSDPLLQALDYGTAVLEPIQGRRDSATCSGPGFVMRRSIVMQYGGFPTASFNEDVLLSSLLLLSGWRISHTQEAMQFGLVPESFSGHVTQRQRWSLGVCQLMGISRSSVELPITSMQRFEIFLEGFQFAVHLFSCAAALVITPLALLSGESLLSEHSAGQLKLIIVLSTLHQTFAWTHELMTAASCQFFVWPWAHLNQVWITPLQVYGLIRYILLGKRRSVMGVVTGRITSKLGMKRRPSWLHEYKLLPVDLRLVLYAVLLQVTIAALLHSLHHSLELARAGHAGSGEIVDVGSLARASVTRLAFPPAAFLVYINITQCWVPISFHLNRVKWPRVADTLERDHTNAFGTMYPTSKVKDAVLRRVRPRYGRGGHYFMVVLVLIWAVIGARAL